jgi:hypothetical protein
MRSRLNASFFGVCMIGLQASLAAAQSRMVITEWMYQGGTATGGEYVEFTNVGDQAADLTGWSFDDSARQPGSFDLSPLGVVLPGESVLIAEDPAEAFRSVWGIGGGTKVVGALGLKIGSNLGRSDEINLFDAAGDLVDRLTYGDETFPGTPRTRWVSGNPATAGALGVNDVYQWVTASAGDLQNSWLNSVGDRGSPGAFAMPPGGQLPGPVEVSHASGFYSSSFAVGLQATGDAIHYTLDGSIPTLNSPIYTGSILIQDRTSSPNYFSSIVTSPVSLQPNGLVFKATVLRAAAINQDGQAGPVETRTFFVHPAGADRFTLPVVSVVTEERNFFDYNEGIYVPGVIYDEMFDPGVSWWNREGNYSQRGDEWERPARIEFFESDGTLGFAQDVGVRVHGGASRAFPRKSLRIYARSEYGQSTIQYPLFPGDAQTEFKRLIIRNSGNDHERTLFRDAFIQDLVKDAGVATQLYRPVVVFINGEYWGVQNIRQRYDNQYLALRKGVDPDNIDYLTGPGAEVEEGDAVHFLATYAYILDNDPADPVHFDFVRGRIDLENFATYYAIQLFIGNSDWPQNNIDYWRPRTETGRWRWLLYDTDLSFNHSDAQGPGYNAVDRVLSQLVTRNARILQRVLLNQGFRNDFINRSADLMNAEFSTQNMTQRLAAFKAVYAPEIPEHILRWRTPQSFAVWENSMVARMQAFINARAGFHRQHLSQHFGLPGSAQVTVVNPHPARGALRISTIDLPGDGAPWQGAYFRSVPVPVRGEAAEGYRFAGFEELPQAPADGVVVWVPQSDQTLTARFVCEADFDGNGAVNFFDIAAYLAAFSAGEPAADLAAPAGVFNFFDLAAYIQMYNAGCP